MPFDLTSPRALLVLAQSQPDSGAVAAFLGVVLLVLLVGLAVAVIIIIGMWKIFEKAGKPGWAAIVPIYNLVVLVEIVGRPTIWVLWMLIPFVNLYFTVVATNDLARSFGKDLGFTVGLLLLPFIFYPMLGFGDDRYLGPAGPEGRMVAPQGQGQGSAATPPPPPPPSA